MMLVLRWRELVLCMLLTLDLWVLDPAHAQGVEISKPVVCFTYDALVGELLAKYGETLQWTYLNHGNDDTTEIAMYQNPGKFTWTLLEVDVRHTGACLLASGKLPVTT